MSLAVYWDINWVAMMDNEMAACWAVNWVVLALKLVDWRDANLVVMLVC